MSIDSRTNQTFAHIKYSKLLLETIINMSIEELILNAKQQWGNTKLGRLELVVLQFKTNEKNGQCLALISISIATEHFQAQKLCKESFKDFLVSNMKLKSFIHLEMFFYSSAIFREQTIRVSYLNRTFMHHLIIVNCVLCWYRKSQSDKKFSYKTQPLCSYWLI